MNILHMVTVRSAVRDEYAYHMGYVCCFVVVSPTRIHSWTINVKYRQEIVVAIGSYFSTDTNKHIPSGHGALRGT